MELEGRQARKESELVNNNNLFVGQNLDVEVLNKCILSYFACGSKSRFC